MPITRRDPRRRSSSCSGAAPAGVGAVFGPVMLVWFVTHRRARRCRGSLREPERARGASTRATPSRFFREHGLPRLPRARRGRPRASPAARRSTPTWGTSARGRSASPGTPSCFPALLLNYFGQGALLLHRAPAARVAQPVLRAGAAAGLLYPMVGARDGGRRSSPRRRSSRAPSRSRSRRCSSATCRASRIVHTSGDDRGADLRPGGELGADGRVRRARARLPAARATLAAAYGIAVTGTMSITSVLFYAVARERWGWRRLQRGRARRGCSSSSTSPSSAPTCVKIAAGRLVPARGRRRASSRVMTTWKRGRARSRAMLAEAHAAARRCSSPTCGATRAAARAGHGGVHDLERRTGIPPVLLHHLKHNKVLHEQVVLLSIATRAGARACPSASASRSSELGARLLPGDRRATASCRRRTCREIAAPLRRPTGSPSTRRHQLLPRPRDARLDRRRVEDGRAGARRSSRSSSRNARPATAFFGIPPNRVVELGAQIEI